MRFGCGVHTCAECGHLAHREGKCSFRDCQCELTCVDLTQRQLEVFRAAALGLTVKEIAELPGRCCSPSTVDAHLCAVRSKLGVNTRIQVTGLALKLKVITLDELGLPAVALAAAAAA